MKSRTFLRFFAAPLAATLVVLSGAAGAASDQPTLSAVTDPSFVPFEMKAQDSNKMIGFDMDILREVADRAGFSVNVRTMDFNGIIPALQTGNADVAVAAITITDKRAKVVDFSDPYYDSGLKILVRAGNDDVENLKDLEGKRIATKIGSTSYDFLSQRFGKATEIKPYPKTSDMYLALMSRSVDAVFYDVPNVAYFAKTKGQGKVEMVGPLYEGQQYGLAFRKGSKWVEPANKALAAMKEDGTYTQIYKKWFGKAPDAN